MTGITFDGAVIEFTEAKIELYEIIEVMSSLSRECLAKEGVQVRDIATLIELMAKTISSARCVVEFLKAISIVPSYTILPAKDDSPDENENRRGTSATSTPGHNKELEDGETAGRKLFVTPSVSQTQTRNLDTTPLSNNVSTRRRQDISLDCSSIASPVLRVDQGMGIPSTIASPVLPVEVMDLEPPQQCLPPKTPTWTMWRSEGHTQGKALLRNRFDDTNDTNDTRDMSYSFQEGLNAVKEKFEDLSTSKIDDLSTGEIGELIESIKNVEEESIKQAEEDLIMKVSKVIPNNHDQSVINVSKNVSKEKDVENVEFISYEQGIAAVSDRFQNISNVKVEDLTKNEINDLVSSLDSLQEASYRKEEEKIEEKLNEDQEIKNDMYSKQCEEIVQVKEEVIDIKEEIESSYLPVNSTLAPYISPLPVAPPLSPIHLPGIRAGEAISPLALSDAQVLRSCLRGKESITTDRKLGWKEEAELWWFPRQQGWVSVPREGGNTLGMEAAHCLKEEVKVALGEEEQEQPDTTDHSATDQSTLSSCSGVTMTKSRSSPRLLQAQSSSSSGYSSASSSTTSSSALLPPSSIKEDPDEIDSYNSSPPTFSCPAPPPKDTNSKKSMKKATRSSSRLSMAPVVFGSQSEEWRSQSTKPGVLKLSRVSASTSKLPSLSSSAMDCSSNSAPNSSLSSSISSLSNSSSMLNSSRGELGTRGLSRVNSRQRKQILKQAGAEMDPTEGEMLKEIRESRLRANCGCNCKGECKEETCECVQSGVTCHEEEPGEPCACTHQLCNNPSGRYRFDRTQVKMHFAEVKMGIVCLN